MSPQQGSESNLRLMAVRTIFKRQVACHTAFSKARDTQTDKKRIVFKLSKLYDIVIE
jgi:hypothetical protein